MRHNVSETFPLWWISIQFDKQMCHTCFEIWCIHGLNKLQLKFLYMVDGNNIVIMVVKPFGHITNAMCVFSGIEHFLFYAIYKLCMMWRFWEFGARFGTMGMQNKSIKYGMEGRPLYQRSNWDIRAKGGKCVFCSQANFSIFMHKHIWGPLRATTIKFH